MVRGNWTPVVRRVATQANPSRNSYPHFERIQTRWNDNDAFGHINNAIYYAYMDDGVNAHLLKRNVGIDLPRFVAQSSCRYMKPLSYPSPIDVGLSIERLGTSSASYSIGIFGADDEVVAALGTFVHVYVDAKGRPTPIGEHARAVLSTLAINATD